MAFETRKETVEELRSSSVQGNPSMVLAKKLKFLKEDLERRNREKFGLFDVQALMFCQVF